MKSLTELARRELGLAQDNLYRARMAAKNCNPDLQWGQSGQTLREIIHGYEEWEKEAKETLAKAESLEEVKK